MGTRSLTVFEEEFQKEPEEIAVLYTQYDGYPSGHGRDLCDFLMNIKIVNGIGILNEGKIANGMDCLAAQIVAHFKDGVGGTYLMRANTRNVGEVYVYKIFHNTDDGEIHIGILDAYEDEEIFSGSVDEMDEWLKMKEKDNE